MEEEFDIFGKLNDMCNNNLLGKLRKTIKESKNSNDVELSESDIFGSDTESKEKTKTDQNNRKNKKADSGEKAKSRSVSPVTKIIEEQAAKKAVKGRPTRRSMRLEKSLEEKEIIQEPTVRRGRGKGSGGRRSEVQSSTDTVESSRSKGRGRGRAGGTGKGRGRTRSSVGNEPDISNDTFEVQELEDSDSELLIPTQYESSGQDQEVRSTRRHVMRARRQYYADKAARSTNVDFIDLASSPNCSQTVITIDCDEMEKKADLEDSFNEDNPEVSVKIKWGSEIEVYKIRRYQKFAHIFQELSKKHNVPIDRIFLNLESKIITAEDTVDSLKYRVFQFIGGRALDCSTAEGGAVPSQNTKPAKNRDLLSLKIQCALRKKPFIVEMLKTDTFKILYIKCAEELDVACDKIKLSFDGDVLLTNDTPKNVDLHNDEIIDLVMKK